MDLPDDFFAAPTEDLLPVRDLRAPIRALVASLAPGGAERIVIEWLHAESRRGRDVELAVLHARRIALAVPSGVRLRVRAGASTETFLETLAADWQHLDTPISAHLITDAQLAVLWSRGVRTVPVVHNSRDGWRNDPRTWPREYVPMAVACAAAVRDQLSTAGCKVPIVVVRHRPGVGSLATDPGARATTRTSIGVGDETFLIIAVGAFKAQKHHARAVEVLAALAQRRDAVLAILGGLLDRSGRSELDQVLDTAVRLGVADRLRLPGFVMPIEPWLAAADALVNVSRFEGLSIAVQEALSASVPVVATDVGGQREIAGSGLQLLTPRATAEDFAGALAVLPVRKAMSATPVQRAPRAWSLTLVHRKTAAPTIDTLFVTANLNAGGAQRSLVNLTQTIARRHRFAVAVCGETTHPAFARSLRESGVETFRASIARDDFSIAESLLAHASERRAGTLCFWNVAPGVKLLVAAHAPRDLRLIDVSPGGYAHEELEGEKTLSDALAFAASDYYARLDDLVLKYHAPRPPPCRRIHVIPNGVALRARAPESQRPRFLVHGRIAPSKRLDTIFEGLALLRDRHPLAELHVFGHAEPRHAQYAASLVACAPAGVIFRGPDFHCAYLAEAWTATIVLGTHQGCPNAVLEAFSAGIPVIANASGGTGELVKQGATGWLLEEACRTEALAQALQEACDLPRDARARGLTGRALVCNQHGLEKMAAGYLRLLIGNRLTPAQTQRTVG